MIMEPAEAETKRSGPAGGDHLILFLAGAWSHLVIALQQGIDPFLMGYASIVQTPGTQTDRQVIQPWSVAGTVEIDDAGQVVAGKEGVVGKQIAVTQPRGQVEGKPMKP